MGAFSYIVEYDNGVKLVNKAKNLINKEGIPPFYLGMLVLLEDRTDALGKDDVRKMSKINARAFNTLRQKVRKGNKAYTSKIEDYRQNPPAASDEEDDQETEEDDLDDSADFFKNDSEEEPKPAAKSKWFGSSDSDSEDDSDDYQPGQDTASKWYAPPFSYSQVHKGCGRQKVDGHSRAQAAYRHNEGGKGGRRERRGS